VEKNGRATQGIEDNGACALHAGEVHSHIFGICNTYCFSTATVVTRTRLNVVFMRTLPVLFTRGTEQCASSNAPSVVK
jgi:hypothetical protein